MPDRPLRILHLLLTTESGGLSRYVIDLSNATVAAGHEVLVAGDVGAWESRFQNQRFQRLKIPLRRGLSGFLQSRRSMTRWLNERPVDLIHTHYRRATLLARGLQVRSGRPPILYTLHLSHIPLGWPRRWLTDFGDHAHVASQDALEWLVRDGRVPAERIALIPHGIDVARFPERDEALRSRARTALGLAEDEVAAVFVGRLEEPKNESWLLDLAASASPQVGKLRIVLAGDGPNAPGLRDRIDAENLHDRVRLLGEIDPLPLYQAADALLLPSAREGFSYVCAEAMSVGVPVLRTRTGGTTATVIEGVTGRSTPIDRDAFLSAAVAFLSDRSTLARMGRAAATHVREHLTFDLQVSRTLDLYRSLARLGQDG